MVLILRTTDEEIEAEAFVVVIKVGDGGGLMGGVATSFSCVNSFLGRRAQPVVSSVYPRQGGDGISPGATALGIKGTVNTAQKEAQ